MAPRPRPALLLLCCCLLSALPFGLAAAAQRVVLVEEVTSQTCVPCADTNPYNEQMLNDYGAQVTSIKWHVWWPAPGDDWFYEQQQPVVAWRVGDAGAVPPYGFYQGAAAPSFYIDGGPEELCDGDPSATGYAPANRQHIDQELLIPAPIRFAASATTGLTNVDVSIDMTVETPTLGTNNRLFAALTEEHVDVEHHLAGTRTATSFQITGLASTEDLYPGLAMTSPGVLFYVDTLHTNTTARTRIKTVDSPTQVTLYNSPSSSGTATLDLKSYNGETEHHDVFRRINNDSDPTQTGVPVDLTVPGTQHFTFSLPHDAAFDRNQLHVVIWAQNMSGTGQGQVFNAMEVTPTVVSVNGPKAVLAQLGQNFPNPFRSGHTTIPFALAREGGVNLSIYSPAGRLVRELISGTMGSGNHMAQWDGRDASGRPVGSGIFYYRIRTGGYEESRRMVMMR